MGWHLPGAKVTGVNIHTSGKTVEQAVFSPSHFPSITTPAVLKDMIDERRNRSRGRLISVNLAIMGGFRTSRDLARNLPLDAEAVTVASAALMALGCDRSRVCHNGKCPAGSHPAEKSFC